MAKKYLQEVRQPRMNDRSEFKMKLVNILFKPQPTHTCLRVAKIAMMKIRSM